MSAVEERQTQDIQVSTVLPIVPLKETVVFPSSMTPLAIGEERSVRLVDEAVTDDKPIALDAGFRFTMREGGKTVGSGKVTRLLQ